MAVSDFQRILICDDHPVIFNGLVATLQPLVLPGAVFTHAANGAELLARLEPTNPDLLLLDLKLPDISGLDLLRQIRRGNPGLRIIVMTMVEQRPILQQVLEEQVQALLWKSFPTENFPQVLEWAMRAPRTMGFVDPAIRDFLDADPVAVLTPRESEIVGYLVNGHTNRGIAEKLRLSVETVKTHRGNISRKTMTTNRAELIAWYLDQNATSKTSIPSATKLAPAGTD